MKALTACIFAAVLLLGACSSEDTSSTSSDYTGSTYVSSEDIGESALQDTWDGMSSSDQEDICGGWFLIQEEIIDTVREGNEDYLTREEIRSFLNDKCVNQFTGEE